MSKRTLKSLEEEASQKLDEESFIEASNLYDKIISTYPKNKLGYIGKIKSETNMYKKYLSNNNLKEIKKIYENAYELSNKEDKKELKNEFERYLDDCQEVENLKKIKKDIVSNEVLKKVYSNVIATTNSNIDSLNKYNLSGKRITNVYDLVKALFFVFCLIYNLIFRNYLLLLTIPFGIYGVIIIYSFINMNFLKQEVLLSEKVLYKRNVKRLSDKISDLKKEIENKDKSINSFMNNKNDNILRIPSDFIEDIDYLVENNEERIATDIVDNISNVAAFTYLLSEHTNLSSDEIFKIIDEEKKDNFFLFDLINSKKENKKNNQNELLIIKQIKSNSYLLPVIFIVISTLSAIIIFKNLQDLEIKSFMIAIIIGIISTLIYNIKDGKHNTYIDTINDSMILTVFTSSLVYDLVYYSVTNTLKFTYAFIKIPIIFGLLFIGFVSVISLLKYKNLFNKLRK